MAAPENRAPVGAAAFWPADNSDYTTSGWRERTDCQDRFLQGVAADFAFAEDGGAATHNHVYVGVHSHIVDAHEHTVSGGVGTPNASVAVKTQAHGSPDKTNTAVIDSPGHTESFAGDSGQPNNTAWTDSSITISAVAMKPLYYRVRVIEPDTFPANIPDGAVCLAREALVGYDLCDGGGSPARPNMVDRFLFGRSPAVEEAGVTGGAATHFHTEPTPHTHTPAAHLHSPGETTFVLFRSQGIEIGVTSGARSRVHHHVELNNETLTITADPGQTDAASSEPAYKKMLAVVNTIGAPHTPVGIVLPWFGPVDEIPDNWQLCDGTAPTQNLLNVQVKCTATVGAVGATGGADDHLQTYNHFHTCAAHTHTTTVNYVNEILYTSGGVSVADHNNDTHTHVWTISSEAVNSDTKNLNSSTSDGRYLYRTCLFVEKIEDVPEGIGGVGGSGVSYQDVGGAQRAEPSDGGPGPSFQDVGGAQRQEAGGGAALVKIVNETEQFSEGVPHRLMIVRSLAETEQVSDGTVNRLSIVRSVSETVELAEAANHQLALGALVRIVTESESITEVTQATSGLVRELSESVAVSEALVSLLSAPQLVANLPLWPVDLVVRPVAGGKFSVSWSYDPFGQGGPPKDFRVYAGADAGSIDYGTPLGTVPYSARRMTFTTLAFADGTPKAFVVRARSAAAVEELNTYASPVVTAKSIGPADATIKRANQL